MGDKGYGTLNIQNGGIVRADQPIFIGPTGVVNLNGGRIEFTETSLASFNRINATAGYLEGIVNVSGENDTAAFASLQNPSVDLSEIAVAFELSSTTLVELGGVASEQIINFNGNVDLDGTLNLVPLALTPILQHAAQPMILS